ncbi:MAG TPA: hypothetical protein VKQ36_04740, partial [Ktedonobacterales bacterium]|nr:hypothetical protein [Ktedonobacterales bacterium]
LRVCSQLQVCGGAKDRHKETTGSDICPTGGSSRVSQRRTGWKQPWEPGRSAADRRVFSAARQSITGIFQ